MFIATERTPNPATLKFLPGQTVMAHGTANFPDAEAAAAAPLARDLFTLEGVTGVFFGADFISVTQNGADWAALKPQVLGLIMDHLSSGAPLLEAAVAEGAATGVADDPADAAIVDQIKDLLDSKVRPAVAQDGGDIVYQGFSKGVVYLHMQGACSGCPSSTMTLKNGIENLLRHYVPEVIEVRAV
ncbi:MAG: NifU family protein [Pseudomonadota bacterium]|jgi:Fe-S cluster biogenesis protein NfuA